MKSPPIKTICDQVRAKRTTKSRPVLMILLFAGLILVGSHPHGYAESGIWLANPVDNNWNNPANWSSGTVPTGYDSAIFETSSITDIEIPAATSVGTILFSANASAYTIAALGAVGVGDNSGITNFSTTEQNFVAGMSDSYPGFTLRQPTIIGPVNFTQQASDVFTYFPPSVTLVIAGAGGATFHNLGASVPGGMGGQLNLYYLGTSAEEATIINDGASVAGATGGSTSFTFDRPSAGNATLIANGGADGGGGGNFRFDGGSSGGTARVELFGNGYMDMSSHSGPSLSIGSIEGDGQIYLGKATLIVGTNSLSTTFPGVLHPGSPTGGNGSGALSKTGTGTLSLSGANLYTNGTTVTKGVLTVSNTSSSGTGIGPVDVNAGTLGGSGIIAGAVTVGTRSGAGAYLTPGIGTNNQTTLTIQSALTFNADATFIYTFKGNRNRTRTDLVIANGVTINGGTIAINSSSQNRLRRGTVLTVINNTSANPISGMFTNLPDGGIVTVNGNNLQASYEGGDGNDLTLTVVP